MLPQNPSICSKLERVLGDDGEKSDEDYDLQSLDEETNATTISNLRRVLQVENSIVPNYLFLAELSNGKKLVSSVVDLIQKPQKQVDKELQWEKDEEDGEGNSRRKRKAAHRQQAKTASVGLPGVSFGGATFLVMKSTNYYEHNSEGDVIHVRDYVPFRVGVKASVTPKSVELSGRDNRLYASFEIRVKRNEIWDSNVIPQCWMAVSKGNFVPFASERKDSRYVHRNSLRRRYSHGRYTIDFGMPGNPWKDRHWEFEIKATLYEAKLGWEKDHDFSKFDDSVCSMCPTGSLCGNVRRRDLGRNGNNKNLRPLRESTMAQRTEPDDEDDIKRNAKVQKISNDVLLLEAYPLDRYCSLYFDKQTFGACNVPGLPHVKPLAKGSQMGSTKKYWKLLKPEKPTWVRLMTRLTWKSWILQFYDWKKS